MSEIIISNDIEDYRDCIGMTLRGSFGFQLGEIVDVEHHIIAMWNRPRVVFVLDDGMRAFADETHLAKRKSIVTDSMVEARQVRVPESLGVPDSDNTSALAIGKGVYRNGAYYGTVISDSCDENGRYAKLSSGHKIRLISSGKDEYVNIVEDAYVSVDSIN